ncbi:MAG: PilZ domain-containing protein [Acidobacteria bacterium]|nr:PilZ domain-containing protein [Acidobacteriota bacterium]
MPKLRSVRVTTQPIQVRIGGVFGRLVDISATGALVQGQHTLSSEREWPMLINVEPEPIELRARVVRSNVVSVQLSGATWQRKEYALGVAFTELPPKAKAALKALCGEAFGEHE